MPARSGIIMSGTNRLRSPTGTRSASRLSYHLGDPLDAEVIWAEILVVRPKIDPSLREFLDICITACNKGTWQPAEETDVRVHSEKQGFAGMIDRILPDGSFSIIRAAGAMPFGTYAADRLRVAAIALCLEEMTGQEVKGGHVEYIPDGVSPVPYRPAPGPAPADHDPVIRSGSCGTGNSRSTPSMPPASGANTWTSARAPAAPAARSAVKLASRLMQSST